LSFIKFSLECPFKFSFKYDDREGIYELGEKTAIWIHNHQLNFKGPTKSALNELKEFAAKEQTKKTHKPSEIRDKVNSFAKGKEENDEFSMSYQKCSNIHYANLRRMYGLPEEDAENLQELFKLIKNKFPKSLCEMSFRKVTKNNKEINQLENFAVSTEKMSQLYNLFNDVVLVDTTYKTNRFRMPLLVIAGINEDSKIFLLGFALLASEKEENVKWAFQKIFSHLNKKPLIICSDSCPTLNSVIANLFPSTHHLWCGWHVEQNLAKHLQSISKNFFQLSFFKF